MSLKQTHLPAILLVRHTNHKLNYDDNCLIYLLSCKCCGKQYVWEATDNFRYRWNNFKDNDRKHSRKENFMQEYLLKHFNSMEHNGFLNNISATLTAKADDKNPKKREGYWRRTLKAYPPFEFNVEDSVYLTHIAKYLVYGLPFYCIVWILVRQGPFMD